MVLYKSGIQNRGSTESVVKAIRRKYSIEERELKGAGRDRQLSEARQGLLAEAGLDGEGQFKAILQYVKAP